jgi:YHS domain-containing protein
MNDRWKVWLGCLALIAVAGLLVACEKQESLEAVVEEASDAIEEMEEAVAETTEPLTLDVETQAKMTAVLSVLDAADGTTDLTVRKCMCGMDVEGSKQTVQVEGYTMNFCSASCKDTFQANPAESVMKMGTPAPEM